MYYGQVLTNAQLLKRYPAQDGVYVMQGSDGRFVDGAKVLSLAARVNHGRSPLQNARFEAAGGLFPVLVNTKKIKQGVEIRANYGKQYFGSNTGHAIERGFAY